MAKKQQRWENEDAAFANPFAALKKPSADSTSVAEAVAKVEAPKEVKLPKAKSARIERAHRGGKSVTLVYFHGTPDDVARSAWLKKTKAILGIGGQIEDDHVYLQGEQIDRLKAANLLPA